MEDTKYVIKSHKSNKNR